MHILESITSTFRGRKMSFAQLQASSVKKDTTNTINRWTIYKQLCIAKSVFGLNDRCLAVLSSLLSFAPQDELSEKTGLVVFPSNRQLALRAHGMPESTLRRHLNSLIGAGIIARRDSPNGKRYAYKDKTGAVEEAFGFSVAPLLARATQIAEASEKTLADTLQLKRTREQITLQRRDLAEMIDAALADAPSPQWSEAYTRFRAIVDAIPRRATLNELQIILGNLVSLRENLDNILKLNDDVTELSVNHAQTERHHIESLPESHIDSKNIKTNDLKVPNSLAVATVIKKEQSSVRTGISIDTVLRTCPDIQQYAVDNIRSWRDLIDASRIVSGFLGIGQSTYQEASEIMGRECVSTIIAWMLQRVTDIKSAGAYLRTLTQKAKAGQFSARELLLTGMQSGLKPVRN